MPIQKVFFHVDLDAFFASVEQLDNPEYRNKPVIVGGKSRRSVVSTCSYEARKFGVHSAMPIMQARKLCPNGIFVFPRMNRYHEKSKEVMTLFNTFTPEVQQISIDEAFLNMTGMEKLFGKPELAALKLKNKIKEKTGLAASIGCGSNKYIAKIASGKSKPDGLFAVPPGCEEKFMRSLSLKDIWGIGEKTRQKLIASGLNSVEQISSVSENLLCSILGNAGGCFLYKAVRGAVTDFFSDEVKNRSISTERTFEYDLYSQEQIDDIIFLLSNEIMYRIIDEKIQTRTVSVKIRYGNFTTVSIQETGEPINDLTGLYLRVKKLFYKKFDNRNGIRLLGISVTKDKNNDSQQLELFCSEDKFKKRKIEETVYALAKAKGKNILQPARIINYKDRIGE